MQNEQRLARINAAAQAFVLEAHAILGRLETSSSRIITLDVSYATLDKLSVKQDDLFRQALRCVEHELFRAAHVMAWAALMDFLEDQISAKGMPALKDLRPGWKGDTIEVLREHVSEYQLVEVTRELGLCTKNQMKALHGLLNKRNECAHPSEYFPDLNETLGFVSEIIQRVRQLQSAAP